MPYSCPVCHKLLKTKKSLARHLEIVHEENPVVTSLEPPKLRQEAKNDRAKRLTAAAEKLGATIIEVPDTKKRKNRRNNSMETQPAIQNFIKNCQEKGLAPGTIRAYQSHLRHFALAFPDGLPWEPENIEWFLTKTIRKKDARPQIRKSLQAFYKFLERENIGKSPISPGKRGRPRKLQPPTQVHGLFDKELVRGGSLHISLDITVHHEFEDIFVHHYQLSGTDTHETGG